MFMHFFLMWVLLFLCSLSFCKAERTIKFTIYDKWWLHFPSIAKYILHFVPDTSYVAKFANKQKTTTTETRRKEAKIEKKKKEEQQQQQNTQKTPAAFVKQTK